MRQYDVVANPTVGMRSKVPYVLVLQSHLFAALDTVIVAPLFKADVVTPENLVMLDVEINGEHLTLDMALLANIEHKRLGSPVANLTGYDYEIRRALDRLMTGF